jgi:carbon-monoxide dehydrogenase large subunit
MSAVEQGAGDGYVGQALRRKEDPRLITGSAVYTDDIKLPGMLHATIVRSTEAHARIVSVETEAAAQREGVRAVLTGEDLADLDAPLPMAWVPPGVEVKRPEHWPLARGKVCHVGDPVAVVVGEDRYAVVDAAEDVIVEYDPLPVVVDPERALDEGAPVIHEQLGDNKSHEWSFGGGDLDRGFEEAEVVVERRRAHAVVGQPDTTLGAPGARRDARGARGPAAGDRP